MSCILLCNLPIQAHEIYTPSSNSRDLEQESMAPKPTQPLSSLSLTHSFAFFLSSLSLTPPSQYSSNLSPGHPLCLLQTHSRHSAPLPQNWYKQYYFLIAKISRKETS